MLALRHARLWRALSVFLLAGVILATLAPPAWFMGDDTDSISWLPYADKWMHAITFAGLALWFCGLYDKRRYGLLAAALLLFGLLIEGCQFLVGYRSAEWLDVLANTAGIIAGLAIAFAGLGGWGPRIEDWAMKRHPQ